MRFKRRITYKRARKVSCQFKICSSLFSFSILLKKIIKFFTFVHYHQYDDQNANDQISYQMKPVLSPLSIPFPIYF